jgi:cyclophilin family peptidyl-prolyl cis-trans isomerase
MVALAGMVVPAVSAGEVKVHLELSRQFYYEQDALDVRVSVHNRGRTKLDNPVKTALVEGFHVRRDDEAIKRTGKTKSGEPSRPAALAPDGFYGAVINLVELYPEIARPGTYEINWSADGVSSNLIVVTILPRFDLTKEYRGTIETDHGAIVLDLYSSQAPIAVKSFIDLANAGYYNGLPFSEVRSDNFILGGDPRFADPPRQPFEFPAEQSTVPLVAGTVFLRPARAAPPANGSTFMITLRPQPAWSGQVTVLGQVIDGLDIVQKISRFPSSMRNSQPNFKPLSDVLIKKVTIQEKPSDGNPERK